MTYQPNELPLVFRDRRRRKLFWVRCGTCELVLTVETWVPAGPSQASAGRTHKAWPGFAVA